MRSESRKETSKSAVAARAKMMQAANLGWLDGFPVEPTDGGVRWATMPPQSPAEEIVVDGRHLSRATYALNKLRTELAPALPRLADEPDRWMESIENRLALLKGIIHHGEPLPLRAFEIILAPRSLRERASRIADADPRLLPLLDAVAWSHAGDPACARIMLDTAAGWADGLDLITERLGRLPTLVLLVRLLELVAEHGREPMEPLVSYLFDRRTHELPTDHGGICTQILGAISKRPKAPLPEGLPTVHRTTHLLLWVEDLIRVNRRTQRLCLRLFALATPLPVVEQWERWWETTRRLIREARILAAQPYDREARQALRTRVEAHQKATPPALHPDQLLERLRRTSKPEASSWTEPLIRALSLVPDGATDHGLTKLFLYWSTQAGDSSGALAARLAGFERYLRSRPVPDPKALLRPWTEAGDGSQCVTVDDEIELADKPRPQILAIYDQLAAVAEIRGGLGLDEAKCMVELFADAGQTGLDREPDLMAAFLDSLARARRLNDYFRGDAIRLAVRLCRSQPESFADVLAVLCAPEIDPDLDLNEWPESVLGPLCSGDLVHFVRESVATRQLSRLMECGLKAIVLDAVGVRPLPLPVVGEPAAQDPTWMGRLPAELHPQLRRLAGLLEDAEVRVGRWLADDLPDAARLEREIAAIQARIDQVEEDRKPALRTRLTNLRSRLEQPADLRPARLERLKTKLERAWGRTVLDRWERDLDVHLSAALQKLIGLEGEVPAWMTEPRNLALIATASRLAPRHRSLAWRLFRERCGPPPWDLRDAPQNLAFRQRLAHLDWSPWLDGVGTSVVQAGETRLHLKLEDDPLEIFRMGSHFQTCLSPGSVNYFSVFTNAADINKRVVFAHDDAGRVVGRCLLALAGDGRLLMFQAYCHDGSLGFESACSDFAADLARRMGTVRVRDGAVPTLVASDWYDDGPRDLGHRFACLEENSELRRKLATVRPGDLLAELRRGLKPARLNEVTLPLVLDLPELRDRPELALPLLRPVAENRNLPDKTIVDAAHLGLRAGAGDLVRHLLVPRLTDHLYQWIRSPWRRDLRAVDVLVQVDPVRLMEVLRRIRVRSARDWSEVTDGFLLESAARTLEALHRPRQAQALWQRLATAMDVHAGLEMRDRARAALKGT
jgi:hypothetical protein